MASLKEKQKELRKETIKREIGKFNPINEKDVLTDDLAKAIFPSKTLLEKEIRVNIYEEVGSYKQAFFYGDIGYYKVKFNIEKIKIREVLEFIEENWNNEDWITRYVVVKLIDLLPEKIAIDYLPYLAILSDDKNRIVSKVAKKIWNKLDPETLIKKMPREKLKGLEKFIENNWKNKDNLRRHISVMLIDLLTKREEFKDKYLAMIATFYVDNVGWYEETTMLAREIFHRIVGNKSIGEWIKELDLKSKEMRFIRRFIENNCGSNDESFRYRSAKLIRSLPREIAIEYSSKLDLILSLSSRFSRP